MPEETAVIAAPESTATQAQPSGTASLMAEMDSMMGAPTPDKPADKPPEKPADTKTAAAPPPKPQTTSPKDETGKFVAKPAPAKDEGPAQLRKRLAEVESDLNKTRAEKETTVAELQRKNADLEKRPFLTKEQQERHDANERRVKELEAQLYSRNYAESPEYKEKYEKRWQARYQTAVRELGSLQVKTTDPESGEEKFRPATQADFERVRGLRGSKVSQIHEAKRLFGDDYNIVIDDIRELDAIESQAQEEVATRRSKFDQEMAEQGQKSSKFMEAVQNSATTTETQLKEKYPDWFGKSDDPEVDAAMQRGLDYVEATTAQAAQLSPEARGQRLTMIRLWAASFPRNVARIQKLEAQLAERDAKIAKLQGTDPGLEADGGETAKDLDNKSLGTAGLVKDF